MKQTYRSKTAFVLGWVWLVFVAFNVWDLIVHYSGSPSLVALAVLGALTALVYAIALRPATVFTEAGLVGRNPFRTTFLPWASIEDVTVSHTINVRHGDERVLRLWTPMSSARERAKAQRRATPKTERRGRFTAEPPKLSKGEQAAQEAFAGKTHADWVGEQIRERAEAARRRAQASALARTAKPKTEAKSTAAEPEAAAQDGVAAGSGAAEPDAAAGSGAVEPRAAAEAARVTWSYDSIAVLLVAVVLVVVAVVAA
ncbi:PH domain-containing protein [Nonomuraea jiangxiensis]|uniref:PH domain-containing protein n=1 Tax=Nonomuraea jiangxiensis TaxID=633440 RepID=A0A1G8FRF8_9ACTN|nr:PH domain-containing protein [Nonomuraea jiangxiensis]SDH84526.1 PH domain-containing protein [Nonomuraea jiangxiensis]